MKTERSTRPGRTRALGRAWKWFVVMKTTRSSHRCDTWRFHTRLGGDDTIQGVEQTAEAHSSHLAGTRTWRAAEELRHKALWRPAGPAGTRRSPRPTTFNGRLGHHNRFYYLKYVIRTYYVKIQLYKLYIICYIESVLQQDHTSRWHHRQHVRQPGAVHMGS